MTTNNSPPDPDERDPTRTCDQCGSHPFAFWPVNVCPGVHEYGDCDGRLVPSEPKSTPLTDDDYSRIRQAQAEAQEPPVRPECDRPRINPRQARQ